MKIIKPSAELLSITPNAEQIIEIAGRTCYQSKQLITADSSTIFIKNIIKRGHEAVLEHASASLFLICDRGVLAELTRHRLASFCAESTRYCNYSKDKFGSELTFIEPCFWKETDMSNLPDSSYNENPKMEEYKKILSRIELSYKQLLILGAKPEEARSILPNSLKTEIVITANMREWRHILRLRTSKFAHPQIREIMLKVLMILYKVTPSIFEDIYLENEKEILTNE